MDKNSWVQGFDPTAKMVQLGEMTLRLARISLFQRLQQAESQLKAMGVPNDISQAFLKSSEEMLKTGFKKAGYRAIRVDTTTNSLF